MRSNINIIDPAEIDEMLFGLVHLPAAARDSAAWAEWCAIVQATEDEGDIDVEDLPIVVETFAALRRMGAVFHARLTERLDAMLTDLRTQGCWVTT